MGQPDPAGNVAVRAALPADLTAVAAIYAHYVTDTVATFEEVPPTVADWRRRLDDLAGRDLPFLVAEQDGAVAGYAYVSPWRPRPAYRHTVEDSVYLSPGQTGRGLGRALLGELLAGCGQAGARQVIAVIADTGNEASIAPPSIAPPSIAPPSIAPPSIAPPSIALPSVALPSVALPSVALHRRFGFEHAGRLRQVGHKHGRWIDTILMQREL